MEAFGPQDCIGTYSGTKVQGMIQFDLAQCAMQPQLADDLMQTVYPTLVCICAGFTWVDGCEKDAPKANAMNNAGPATVAAAAKAHGARVVWYSTDYVFDGGVKGKAGPYGEDDPVSPLNIYGSSKLRGESEVLKADPSALVIRTNVVFGPEGVGKNFVYQLIRKLRAGEPMTVPNDQVNTPTYNRDLARATMLLVKKGASGLFNIGGCEVLDRLAFANAVVDSLNTLDPFLGFKFDAGLLKGVATSNAGQTAMRPLASGLKLDKIKAVLPEWKPSTIHEALADWMQRPTGKPLGQ